MAAYFTDVFTAADASTWESLGFSIVLGSTSNSPLIYGNKGQGSALAGERVLRTGSFPGGVTDYKGSFTVQTKNAGGSSRVFGIGVRVQLDGQGYYFLVDSNLGSPLVLLRRREESSWTNLDGGWKAGPAFCTAATLNAGTDILKLQCQNVASGVRLKAWIGTTLVYDFTDTAANFIGSGGSLALYFGSTSTLDDVKYDDLTAQDFVDDAAALGVVPASGLVIAVDGVYYDKYAREKAGIDVLPTTIGYDIGPAGTLVDAKRFHEPVLYAGQSVKIYKDGTIVASGILRTATHALSVSEGNAYEIVSPIQMALEVPIQDPTTGIGTITFNPVQDDETERDSNKANKNTGQALKYLFDNHTNGDDKLRDLGAAPSSIGVKAYVQSELDALTVKVPNVTASGSFAQAVFTLLAAMPDYGVRIDAETKIWHFEKRSTASYYEIDIGSQNVSGKIQERPDLNYTAVLVRGSRPEAAMVTMKFSAGELPKAWPTALEPEYTPNKAWKSQDTSTVSAVGIDGSGRAYIDVVTGPNFGMSGSEWKRVSLTFPLPSPAFGSTFYVQDNTTTRITFTSLGWPGSAPVVGDVFILSGLDDQNVRDNAFKEMYRTFTLPDGKAFQNGRCAKATITTKNPDGGITKFSTKVTIKTPDDGSKSTATLDVPALQPLGLVNYAPDCSPGGSIMADDIEITAPVLDGFDAAAGTPKVLTKRWPTRGYSGTAFSFNSATWNGAGQPGKGDARVRRVFVIDDPNFQDPSEATAYEDLAKSILAVMSPLARTAEFTIKGIDVTFASLNKRIRLKDSRASNPPNAPRTTGYESATDLWLIGVTFDWKMDTMTLNCGTQAGLNAFDVAAQRQIYVEQTRFDDLKRAMAKTQEFLDCLQKGITGGGDATQGNPNPVCASQVATGGGKSAEDSLSGDCTTQTITVASTCSLDCMTGSSTDFSKLWDAANILDSKNVTGQNFIEYVCCVMNVTNYVAKWLYAWGKSVDHELGKGRGDIAELQTCVAELKADFNTLAVMFNALVLCANGRFTNLFACIQTGVAAGGGVACVDPGACVGGAPTIACATPTPEMCDPVCAMTRPSPDPECNA